MNIVHERRPVFDMWSLVGFNEEGAEGRAGRGVTRHSVCRQPVSYHQVAGPSQPLLSARLVRSNLGAL